MHQSPDGSHFLVSVNGKNPKLLFIPIKANIKIEDIIAKEVRENN